MELSLKAAFSNALIGPGGLVCLKVCLEISEGGDSFAYTEKTELLTFRLYHLGDVAVIFLIGA